MPPYSSSSQQDFGDDLYVLKSLKNDSVDVTPPPLLTSPPSTDSAESVFDKILDKNFCVVVRAPTNPFKTRTCNECNGPCSKFQGYRKELVVQRKSTVTDTLFDEDESIGKSKGTKKTKQYYHKWCYQLKQYREEHKLTSGLSSVVLEELLEHFRSLEREQQLRAILAEKETKEELERSLQAEQDQNDKENKIGQNKTDVLRSTIKKNSKKLKKSFKRVKGSVLSSSNKKSFSLMNTKPQTIWDEYTDPATGNAYWFDGVVTTWDKPQKGTIRKE